MTSSSSSSSSSKDKKFYINNAIAYLNGPPHIGHLLEYVQIDAVARFYKMKGENVVFQVGTDEHGVKIYDTATKMQITPQELVDQNYLQFVKMFEGLGLSHDRILRTTDKEKHLPSVEKMWNVLMSKGDIYKKNYKGTYCAGCESFKTESELDDSGKCPIHQNQTPKIVEEENYFFKLSKYQDQIEKIIESDQYEIIPKSRKNEILSFIKGGLQDVSFSRPADILPWGIKVPGDPNHVIYVWCDALVNYISGSGYGYDDERFAREWPAQIHLIGKDILRFHAAIWPAMLLSAGIDLPKRIFVHGFILAPSGQKMSKSEGNVIDPILLLEKYGPNPIRYFMLHSINAGSDSAYSEDLLIESYNSNLANNYGNLLNRTLGLAKKNNITTIDGIDKSKLTDDDKELLSKIDVDLVAKYLEKMGHFEFNFALDAVFAFLSEVNRYFTKMAPWGLKGEENLPRLKQILYITLESLRVATILLTPVIPESSKKFFDYFSIKRDSFKDTTFDYNLCFNIAEGLILFPRLEREKEKEKEK
ncbi:MAG: methionine--tRNA ligase [Oligoflexia bacterium]|nr:methionine--tRNA ligase [Oligoflexia bacterium]